MKSSFLVIDKPAGITSHDVVAMLRAVTGVKKVGHTGTLDPFATGVLPLALGPATRLISFLDEDVKVYDAHIALGSTTDTGDPTGTVTRTMEVPPLDRAMVEAALATFKGVRMQAPPKYSAVKLKGKPLYQYAREGQDVEVAPRPTRIDAITLLELAPTELRVKIECGRGTYARVLADEIAQTLGTAGHLRALRRTRSGPFVEERALSLEAVSMIVAGRPDWEAVLRPTRGAERIKWRPRDDVARELEVHAVEPHVALSHLAVLSVTGGDVATVERGEMPSCEAPSGTRIGDSLLVLGPDAQVLAIARREPTGVRVARVVTRS